MYQNKHNILLMPQGTEVSASDLAAQLPQAVGVPASSPMSSNMFNSGPFSRSVDSGEAAEDSGETQDTATTVPAENEGEDTDTQTDYSDIDKMFERPGDVVEAISDKPVVAATEAAGNEAEDNEPAPEDTTAKPSYKLTTNAKGKPVIARDYSDLDDTDKELARNMSGKAFDRFKTLVKEVKTAQQTKQQLTETLADKEAFKSALDHPDAWQLTPEYNQAVSTYNETINITNHLQTQLANATAGEEWEPLTYETGTDGKPRLVRLPPRPATKEAIGQLSRDFNEAIIRKQLAEQQIRALPQQFNAQRQAFTQKLNQLTEKGLEPIWKTLDNNEAAKQMEQSILNEIPSLHRRNELAAPLAKSMTLVWMLTNKLRAQQQQLATKPVIKQEAKLAGGIKNSGQTRSKVTTSALYDDAEELFSRYGK